MVERRIRQDSFFVEQDGASVTLDSIGDAVLSTDCAGTVTYLNAVAEDLTGWSRSEACGRPVTEVFTIIDGATRQVARNPVDAAIRENRIVGLAPNTVLVRRDRSEAAIEDSTSPIRDRGGRVTGAVVVFRDVSRSREMTQHNAWKEEGLGPIPVSVNVSAVEFRHKHYLNGVRTVWADTRLDPRLLELELTETTLMSDADATTEALHALKSLGIQLAVDDFGTGYSSLSYLRAFPVDVLKIDRSFVHEISTRPNDAAIVSAVIGMGAIMRKRVIAEGVETRAQCDFLEKHGCEEAQGFYFHEPMMPEQLALLLENTAA